MDQRKAAIDGIVRQISTRLFFQNLLCFLLVDVLVFLLGVRGGLWLILCALETLILLLFMSRNSRLIRDLLAPMEAMGETADLLSSSDLRPQDLEQLIGRLDKINVTQLSRRVDLPRGGQEMAQLTRAINSMLERIDQGYQAQARFVSDASHELRTPIAVIKGYANLLNRWGKDDPQARQEAIDAIVQESDSMARLVEQLLFLVRGDNDTQSVRLETVDLAALADEVARETQLVNTAYQVRAELEPVVLIRADQRLIKQAFRILVDNALKYTPQGGLITLGLSRKEGYAHLSVTDSGQGIAPEDIQKIFQRFYRTDQSRNRQTGGTGLGLSIAQWIAQKHRGWIDVVSRPQVGSRFTLILPEYDPSSEQTPAIKL